jgi:hypothetical protein
MRQTICDDATGYEREVVDRFYKSPMTLPPY